jgi:hypothetical protein
MPIMSLSQIKSDNVLELKNVVFDVKVLSDFIHENFKEFVPVDGVDRLEGNYLLGDHPFDVYKLNREIISKSTPYTLFEMSVSNIHAFFMDENTFALYFTAYLNNAAFDRMIKQIGPPINLMGEELADPESSPLINWLFDDLDIMVSRTTFGSDVKRWKVQIRTANANHKEFIRF